MRAVALAALLATAGCALDLDYGGASFPCEGGCPDGGPSSTELACASASYVGETFDAPIDTGAWDIWFDDARVDVSGGELVFTVESADADGYAEISSLETFDLREGALEVDVAAPETVATWIYVTRVGGDTLAQIKAEGGNLLFILEADPALGAGADVAVTYDPDEHRYWRLAGSGGRLTWETSPDRVSWTVHRDEPMAEDLRYATVRIGVWDDGTATARIAALNPTAPPVEWCGADELDDVFDGTALDPKWQAFSFETCTVSVFDGELVFTLNGTDVWCAIRPQRPVDLRDGAIGFRVQILEEFARFEVRAGADSLVMQADPATGVIALRNGAGIGAPVPMAEAGWWQMRMDGESVIYEVSADGTTYKPIAQSNGVTGLDESRLELAVSGTAAGAVIAVDDVDGAP